MSKQKHPLLTPDPWTAAKQFTEARIALGRCGSSLPLSESLKFKLAHARARDAVHQPADMASLGRKLELEGFSTVQLASSVANREEYLKRPDKGRCLDVAAKTALKKLPEGFDVGIIICDGLSAPAIDQSAYQLTRELLGILQTTHLTTSPVCLVDNGRVAIGDEIGHLLKTRLALVLIGERPGLSSPNSLGAYLTYTPTPGTTDEARNCISNIRPGGLLIAQAVQKISYFIEMALNHKKTGVELKDRMALGYLPMAGLLPR